MSKHDELCHKGAEGQKWDMSCNCEDIAKAKQAERERINSIIDQFIENSDYPEVASCLEWLQDVINGEK
jgi:hypothetical protein